MSFCISRCAAAVSSATVLLFLIISLVPAGVAAQPCTPTVVPLASVGVDLVRDSNGDPVLLSSSTDRREHVRVSSGLAQALGITADPEENVNPAIRVVVDSETLTNGLRATANFTVVEIYSENVPELEIYAENRDEDEPTEPDEDSGFFKLFAENDSVDMSTVLLTVYPLAPSRTTTLEGGLTTIAQHFCEPNENGDDGFTETVTINNDKSFVLVAPHGAEIEDGTSQQIGPLADVLRDDHGVAANIWVGDGTWDPAKLASEQFHITSKALDGASLPGLGDLMSRPAFAPGQPFQYAASLHGFGRYHGAGLVFGGDAHPETKCFVARAIQQRVSDLGLDKVAYYVYDDDGNVVVDLPDVRNITIPMERGSVGLTGRSSDNIVNRLSPNPGGNATNVGGMQIEESVPLRENIVLRDLVARQIGDAFGQLIADPNLLDPTATTQCDALGAGPIPPAGSVGGRVWLDGNEDGIQDPGEAGINNVTVSLLEAGLVVATTTTDVVGDYSFSGLIERDYAIRVSPPAAHGLGPRDADDGSSDPDLVDSDVDATSGESSAALVTADGNNNLTLDAALVPIITAEIGDRAWIDVDGNGTQDAGEAGLAGVQVTLLANAGGAVIAQTVTDGGGFYTFDLLPAGDYRLRFTAPVGFTFTGTGGGAQGDEANTDSDPDPTTGETGTISVAPGQTDASRDAGFTTACFDVSLVAFGSTWKTDDALDPSWTEIDFVDSGWQDKQGIVGYGSVDVVDDFVPSSFTAYLRLGFDVDDPSLFDNLELALLRDDGAAVYLNGTEVLRSNLPNGSLTASTPASSSNKATVVASIDASLLRAGTNLLAVEVHNRTADSSDLLFDLELSSQVCRPCLAEATLVADRGTTIEIGDNSPNGSSHVLEVDNGGEPSGLLGFPVASVVPAGAEVLHAELQLFVEDGSSQPWRFYPLLSAWDEAVATFTVATGGSAWQIAGAKGANDRDQDRPVAVIDDTEDDTPAVVVLNVEGRHLIEEWAATPATNHGLIIPGDDGSTNDLEFASDDDPIDPRPVLRVVYANSCSG